MPSLTGISQIVCTQAGKNFLDPSIVFENTTTYTYDSATGAVTVLKSDSSAWNTKTELLLKAGTYAVTNPPGRFQYRLASENYGTDHNINATTGTITLSADDGIKIKFGLGATYPFTASYQLERNSTATTFEKYTAPTVSTINLGRTIYGGSVDVVNGTGEETYSKIVLDGTQEIGLANWKPTTGTSAWLYAPSVTPNLLNNYLTASNLGNIVCDVLPTVPYNTTSQRIDESTTKGISVVGTNNWGLAVRVEDDTLRTKTDINAWLANNPITVIYKVATPTDFTFTPISPTPETALGVNNFWADAGDSDVTYRADINMLIASLSGNRGLMMSRPQLEEITEETKEDPEVTEK